MRKHRLCFQHVALTIFVAHSKSCKKAILDPEMAAEAIPKSFEVVGVEDAGFIYRQEEAFISGLAASSLSTTPR